MNGFLGRYEHQTDDKGRVSLPSAFRREADGDRFVLLQWERPYLTLFPEEVWRGVQERLLEFRKREKDAWHHVREILASAVEVVPDRQGRILIPAGLREAAGIDGRVLLNGNLDRVELWDPVSYRTTVQEAAPPESVERFAHQIFG